MWNGVNFAGCVSVFTIKQQSHTVTVESGGINTNSKQYKTVIQQMTKSGCTGNMFTNVQAIKNLMKNYNSKGEFVDRNTGLTGLDVTDETGDSYKKIIDILESSKDKMFEAVKNNFLHRNGMGMERERQKFYGYV